MKRKLLLVTAVLTIFIGGTAAGASGLGFAEAISKEVSNALTEHAASWKQKIGQSEAHEGSQLIVLLETFKDEEIQRGKEALDAVGEEKLKELSEGNISDDQLEEEKEMIRKLTDQKIEELIAEIKNFK